MKWVISTIILLPMVFHNIPQMTVIPDPGVYLLEQTVGIRIHQPGCYEAKLDYVAEPSSAFIERWGGFCSNGDAVMILYVHEAMVLSEMEITIQMLDGTIENVPVLGTWEFTKYPVRR